MCDNAGYDAVGVYVNDNDGEYLCRILRARNPQTLRTLKTFLEWVEGGHDGRRIIGITESNDPAAARDELIRNGVSSSFISPCVLFVGEQKITEGVFDGGESV